MVIGRLVFTLAIPTLILPSAGHAQATLEMTQVTCANDRPFREIRLAFSAP
jgi:hypothetical protein